MHTHAYSGPTITLKGFYLKKKIGKKTVDAVVHVT